MSNDPTSTYQDLSIHISQVKISTFLRVFSKNIYMRSKNNISYWPVQVNIPSPFWVKSKGVGYQGKLVDIYRVSIERKCPYMKKLIGEGNFPLYLDNDYVTYI